MTEPSQARKRARDVTTPPICDFCLGPKVLWAYPVTDFARRPGEDNSGWAACGFCSRLIEAGDFDGLLRRCSAKAARRHRVPRAAAQAQMTEVYERFWRTKGVRVPNNPDDPISDPTADEDGPYTPMLDIAGPTIQMKWQRSPEVIARDGAHKSISREAVDSMAEAAGAWVLSRVIRRWNEDRDRPVHGVKLTLTVEMDDDPSFEAAATTHLHFIPDGETRLRGDSGGGNGRG